MTTKAVKGQLTLAALRRSHCNSQVSHSTVPPLLDVDLRRAGALWHCVIPLVAYQLFV